MTKQTTHATTRALAGTLTIARVLVALLAVTSTTRALGAQAAPVTPTLATSAEAAPDDSAKLDARSTRREETLLSSRQLFDKHDVYVAAAFVAGTVALVPFDQRLTNAFRVEYNRENGTLRSVAKAGTWIGGPGPLIIGSSMFVVGRVGRVPKMAELALHGTEAVVAGTLVANVVKGVVGRARPYATLDTNSRDFGFGRGFSDRDYKAFPSGHAASAFAAAAAIVTETREWWPGSTKYVAPVMYGGATVVGLSRIYNDQHWASDVVVGAAVGTFAGLKVVRFNHTHAGNMIDRLLLGGTVAPTLTANGTGLSVSKSF